MTNDVRSLAWYEIGSGPVATVVLHGFLGSGRNLRGLAKRWAARDPSRRFLVMDLPGHGESPPLPDDAGLDELADAVLETADHAALTWPVHVVGHSLGGRVSLAVARIEPRATASIALLDIAPGAVDPAKSLSRRVLEALVAAPDDAADKRELRAALVALGIAPATADWLLINVESEHGRVRWRFDRRALQRLHERANREDLWAVVESGAVPIRCVRGGHSRYVSDADVERFRAAGCRVDTIAEAAHDLHIDAPDVLVELLAG